MKRSPGIAAAAAAVTLAGLVGAAVPPAAAAETSHPYSFTVYASDSKAVDVRCPAGSVLDDTRQWPGSVGRMVPRGVEIMESGGIGVSLSPTTEQSAGADAAIVGAHGTITNWNVSPGDVIIVLHCRT